MTKTDLKKLKKNLPRSWAKIIASRLDFNPIYVYQVISGDRFNQKIIDEAILLAEETKSMIKKNKERINAL